MRGSCREPALREEALEQQIAASLEQCVIDDEMIMLAKSASDERHGREREARVVERLSKERRATQSWSTVKRRLREKDETAGDPS